MQSVIIVIHLLLVLAMIVTVLLQRSEGGALGIGGGGGGMMAGRGQANVLTRVTSVLAIGFFLTSITLAVLAGRTTLGPRSIFDTVPDGGAGGVQQQVPAPADDATPGEGGVLDQLRQMQPQPGAPQPGQEEPQVPQSQ